MFAPVYLDHNATTPLEPAVREVCADLFTAEVLEIDMDAVAAWAGALQLQPGIVLIAGSGSIALGVNEKRQRARAGGWGYLFGDCGRRQCHGDHFGQYLCMDDLLPYRDATVFYRLCPRPRQRPRSIYLQFQSIHQRHPVKF